MVIVTEVRFAHDRGALAHTITEGRDVVVSVVPEASTDPEQNLWVFRVEGEDPATVRHLLEADHTVDRIQPMEGFEEELWGVVFADDTRLITPLVTSHDGFVLEARSSSFEDGLGGWYERWVLPDRQALHDIWQRARNDGFQFEVLEFRERNRGDPEYTGPNAITDEQREALVMAFERGYFEEPRETSLEDLAAELDVSASAVGARLRRGMNSLVRMSVVADKESRPDE
jgi:hypothetical protein